MGLHREVDGAESGLRGRDLSNPQAYSGVFVAVVVQLATAWALAVLVFQVGKIFL